MISVKLDGAMGRLGISISGPRRMVSPSWLPIKTWLVAVVETSVEMPHWVPLVMVMLPPESRTSDGQGPEGPGGPWVVLNGAWNNSPFVVFHTTRSKPFRALATDPQIKMTKLHEKKDMFVLLESMGESFGLLHVPIQQFRFNETRISLIRTLHHAT